MRGVLLLRRLRDPGQRDVRARASQGRLSRLRGSVGDGNPGNNLLVSTPLREEGAVVGTGQVLERLRGVALSRYAFTRSQKAVVGEDLRLPQAAAHLRRTLPGAGARGHRPRDRAGARRAAGGWAGTAGQGCGEGRGHAALSTSVPLLPGRSNSGRELTLGSGRHV